MKGLSIMIISEANNKGKKIMCGELDGQFLTTYHENKEKKLNCRFIC